MAPSLSPEVAGQTPLLDEGFYPVGDAGEGSLRWASPQFTLRRPRGKRYVDLELGRPDSGGQLTVADGRLLIGSLHLIQGSHWYSLDLGFSDQRKVEFEVDPPIVASDRPGSLGVIVHSVAWHNSSQRHARIESVRANAILNEQEYQSGAVVLRSVPPYLRLTMEVRCNIANKKPCVYCAWKWMKNEEIGSPTSDLSFIKSLGSYLALAKVVNDSSYGEPPLHREFSEIVDLIATDDRAFSFVSNGKTLRRKTRRALLGRHVYLYVSIDAATSSGYARYRDNSFDGIIANLKALCREKKSQRNLPHVTVSFIVMNSNKNELRDFIALMHSTDVDRIKLMSLGREDCMDLDGRVKQRGNFMFDYDKEIIPIAELDVIGQEAKRVAEGLAMDIYIDWEDFPAHHGPAGNQPLCSEPWKTLYALNRGIFPCCFGRKPAARWAERGSRSIGQFIEETFNGAAFQEIRSSLASGQFSSYCMSTPSCPIVRKATGDKARSEAPLPANATDAPRLE